jgi:hypothetical protein
MRLGRRRVVVFKPSIFTQKTSGRPVTLVKEVATVKSISSAKTTRSHTEPDREPRREGS